MTETTDPLSTRFDQALELISSFVELLEIDPEANDPTKGLFVLIYAAREFIHAHQRSTDYIAKST